MDIIEAIVLGIVQGITEWLPVSSSGHLTIVQHLFSDVPLIYSIMLHIATLFVVLIYFRKEIFEVLENLADTFRDIRSGMSFRAASSSSPERMLSWMIAYAIIPTSFLGMLIDIYLIDSIYGSLLFVGIMLIVTGIVISLTYFYRASKKIEKQRQIEKPDSGRDVKRALIVGTMQGVAIFPGLSRSGLTISTGVLLGMDRMKAARFSFLIAIPAIFGAMFLKIRDIPGAVGDLEAVPFVAGMIMAFIVGYLSLFVLMRVIKGGRFHYFTPYCIAAGFLIVAYSVM